jgi:hypothetical protein
MTDKQRKIQRMAGAQRIEADLLRLAAEMGLTLSRYEWHPSPSLPYQETFDLVVTSGATSLEAIFSEEQVAEYQDASCVASSVAQKILQALVKKLGEAKRMDLHMAGVYARMDAQQMKGRRSH